MESGAIIPQISIRFDVAMAIMNRARGMITSRIAEVSGQNHAAAGALRVKRRNLLVVQQSLTPDQAERVEAMIAEWGPRVLDTGLLWQEVER